MTMLLACSKNGGITTVSVLASSDRSLAPYAALLKFDDMGAKPPASLYLAGIDRPQGALPCLVDQRAQFADQGR